MTLKTVFLTFGLLYLIVTVIGFLAFFNTHGIERAHAHGFAVCMLIASGMFFFAAFLLRKQG
jgi:hypothetical protein